MHSEQLVYDFAPLLHILGKTFVATFATGAIAGVMSTVAETAKRGVGQ